MNYLFDKNTYIMISCFILFIIISILSIQNQLYVFDQTLISILNKDNYSVPFNLFMENITKVGSGEVTIIISLLLLLILATKKMWGYSLLLCSTVYGGIILNFILKIIFQRERPGEMREIEVFGNSLEIASYSFPSGHTMRSVILFMFVMFVCYHFIQNITLKTICIATPLLLIVAIALSRVVIGEHYPSDILAAITISIAWFYFCLSMLRIMFKRRDHFKI